MTLVVSFYAGLIVGVAQFPGTLSECEARVANWRAEIADAVPDVSIANVRCVPLGAVVLAGEPA